MGAIIKVGMADLNVCKAPRCYYYVRTRFMHWYSGVRSGNKNRRTRTYHAARQHEDKE